MIIFRQIMQDREQGHRRQSNLLISYHPDATELSKGLWYFWVEHSSLMHQFLLRSLGLGWYLSKREKDVSHGQVELKISTLDCRWW